MQFTYLSRSLFGCTGISPIPAVLFVGTLALAGNARTQEPPSSQRLVPKSPAMAEHKAASTALRELMQEAEQKKSPDCGVVSRVAGLTKRSQAGFGSSRDTTVGAAVQRGQSTTFRRL